MASHMIEKVMPSPGEKNNKKTKTHSYYKSPISSVIYKFQFYSDFGGKKHLRTVHLWDKPFLTVNIQTVQLFNTEC